MNTNPYQAPAEFNLQDDHHREDDQVSIVLLSVLCFLVLLHCLVASMITLLSLLAGSIGCVGGLVATGFYIAIFIGLLQRSEWARVSAIMFCYFNVVMYLFGIATMPMATIPLLALSLVSVVVAHQPRLRRLTQNTSVAKPYIYGQPPP